MIFDRRLGKEFKKSSSDYHSSRKGYPDQIFKDIIGFSKVNENAEILDIGCGSGLSTLPLAKMGYSVIGIDPSNELIKIARQNSINGSPKYINGSFEKYKFKGDSFDLIISGQAFHWLDENVAYKKCARILKEGGHLAIFGKFTDYKRSDFLMEIRKVFMKDCKYYPTGIHQDAYERDYTKEIKESKMFNKVVSKTYEYHIDYNKADYRKLLLSNSWMMKLEERKRESVMKKLDDILDSRRWPMKIPFGAALIIGEASRIS